MIAGLGGKAAPLAAAHRRFLSLHEHQAAELLKKASVPLPRGQVAKTADQAAAVFKNNHFAAAFVKAQVLAGGRGKGRFDTGFEGGVHRASSADEAQKIAGQMLGHRLITKQTTRQGLPCASVYVTEAIDIKHEYYLSIMLDRKSRCISMVGSRSGGMDIEAVAAHKPASVFAVNVGPEKEAACLEVAAKLGLRGAQQEKAKNCLRRLLDAFVANDATLVEINPLVLTTEGDVLCADSKVSLDDNAQFRQLETFAQRDFSQEDPREVRAAQFDLNYIGLDGNIGCMVNGAGLAMATMDIVQLHGGSPANFMDVGGGATVRQVSAAVGMLLEDKKVGVIFINIFGGIMRCDIIAEGIVSAMHALPSRNTPIILRLQGTAHKRCVCAVGTNIEEAKEILKESGVKVHMEPDLDRAAEMAAGYARLMELARSVGAKVTFGSQ